jgi:hypothetical protein
MKRTAHLLQSHEYQQHPTWCRYPYDKSTGADNDYSNEELAKLCCRVACQGVPQLGWSDARDPKAPDAQPHLVLCHLGPKRSIPHVNNITANSSESKRSAFNDGKSPIAIRSHSSSSGSIPYSLALLLS